MRCREPNAARVFVDSEKGAFDSFLVNFFASEAKRKTAASADAAARRDAQLGPIRIHTGPSPPARKRSRARTRSGSAPEL